MADLEPIRLVAGAGRINHARSVTIKSMAGKLAAAAVAVALAGCEPAGAPPGAPGSAVLSVHGRVDVDAGVFSR